jgi:hypothetical protein
MPQGNKPLRNFSIENPAELNIENLPDEDRSHIFYALDNLIKAAKLKAI